MMKKNFISRGLQSSKYGMFLFPDTIFPSGSVTLISSNVY